MFVRRGMAVVAVLGAVLFSSTVSAQASLTFAGGATMPMGDYGDYAKTGYMATAGVMVKTSKPRLSLGGHLLYGGNSHSDFEGDKTTLTGLLGTANYRLADASKPGLFLLANVGFLRHTYSSDKFPSEEGTSSGVAFGGGAGFSIPRGAMSLYATIRYLTASIDGESTAFVPIMAGVSVPLGSKK